MRLASVVALALAKRRFVALAAAEPRTSAALAAVRALLRAGSIPRAAITVGRDKVTIELTRKQVDRLDR